MKIIYLFYRFKCSQNIASLNVLMMLTVLMTVSHLYQKLENIKSAFIAIINTFRSLFKASDTFNVFQVLIKMADSHRNCQHY